MANQDTTPPPPNYEHVVGSTRTTTLTLDQMVKQALQLDDADFDLVIEEGLKTPHRPSTPPPLPSRGRLSNPMLRSFPLPDKLR